MSSKGFWRLRHGRFSPLSGLLFFSTLIEATLAQDPSSAPTMIRGLPSTITRSIGGSADLSVVLNVSLTEDYTIKYQIAAENYPTYIPPTPVYFCEFKSQPYPTVLCSEDLDLDMQYWNRLLPSTTYRNRTSMRVKIALSLIDVTEEDSIYFGVYYNLYGPVLMTTTLLVGTECPRCDERLMNGMYHNRTGAVHAPGKCGLGCTARFTCIDEEHSDVVVTATCQADATWSKPCPVEYCKGIKEFGERPVVTPTGRVIAAVVSGGVVLMSLAIWLKVCKAPSRDVRSGKNNKVLRETAFSVKKTYITNV